MRTALEAVDAYNLGNQYARSGNQQAALEAYARALQLKPDFAEAYSNRGVIWFDLGDYTAAIAEYDQAIHYKADYAAAFHNRGNARLKIGDYFASLKDFKQAAELFAQQADLQHVQITEDLIATVHFCLGQKFASQDQVDLALHHYQAAVALKPEFTEAHYQLEILQKGYQFTTDWFSHNLTIWQSVLSQVSHQYPLQALEIGSWEGRSACWLLDHVLTGAEDKLTCIDTFLGNLEHHAYFPHHPLPLEQRFDQNIRRSGAFQKVEKRVGPSHEILRSLPYNTYDIVYIDGSHFASDVLEDAVLCWRVTKLNGIIIFDDYDCVFPDRQPQNTKNGIDAFRLAFNTKLKLLHQSHQVIVQKIAD